MANLFDHLKDLPAFYWTVKLRNMSSAADKLVVSKSTVSKSVSRLEAAMAMRLIERNSRNIQLTQEGQTLFDYCMRLMALVDEADNALGGLKKTPSGQVNIAMPMAFGREVVAPHLSRFYQQYPDIELKIQTSHHPMDLFRHELDIAVIVGTLENSDLVAKTLYAGKLRWVTTSAYLQQHGEPDNVDELLGHIKICESRYGGNAFVVYQQGHRYRLNLAHVSQCNDPLTVREAVLSGAGITMLPEQYCNGMLHTGQLVEVAKTIVPEADSAALRVVYPSRLFRSLRVRAVLDFLDEVCRYIPGNDA